MLPGAPLCCGSTSWIIMKLPWQSHESGVKPGPLAPASPIQAISLLFTARIRKNQGMLPQPLLRLLPTTYMYLGIPVHVPEPTCRIYCGWGGPAHCTRSNFDYNVHGND